ncbi:hypothetical protein LOC67_22940 [Stieleria sp. JC731]|nr:hypothetical protein [Stieleria sp. JC731]MCC9603415.1 hypothetical protein [Stieleria sp. JC731]
MAVDVHGEVDVGVSRQRLRDLRIGRTSRQIRHERMPVAVEVREDSVPIFVLKEIRVPAAFSFLIGFRFIDPRFPSVRQINTHHLRGLAWIAADVEVS